MLFHSTKKPFELAVINLNDRQQGATKHINGKKQTAKKDGVLCRLGRCLKNKVHKDSDSNADGKQDDKQKTIYVLDFVGDIKAAATEQLREEISAIISAAKAGDEVVLRLESSGGQVHAYGLAAAQLARLKEAGITLTVCVDKVAASGGYMMACVADTLIATPFAIVGSIGVVSQMPNFHEFLKKHDIDVELFTAGEYKRTVTVFGKNDDEDRAKYQSELERIHQLFKAHIAKYRPHLAIDQVATGEFWLGSDAKDLLLVDKLGTSDSYLLEQLDHHRVLIIQSQQKPTLIQKLGIKETASALLEQNLQAVPMVSKLAQVLHRHI